MSDIFTVETDGKPLAGHSYSDYTRALGILSQMLSLGWPAERLGLHSAKLGKLDWEVKLTYSIVGGTPIQRAEHVSIVRSA